MNEIAPLLREFLNILPLFIKYPRFSSRARNNPVRNPVKDSGRRLVSIAVIPRLHRSNHSVSGRASTYKEERFVHDLESLSLDDAIQRHKGEASQVERCFDELSPTERDALLTFLKSL